MTFYTGKSRNLKIAIHKLAESIAWQIAKDRGFDKITPEVRIEAKQRAAKQLMPRY